MINAGSIMANLHSQQLYNMQQLGIPQHEIGEMGRHLLHYLAIDNLPHLFLTIREGAEAVEWRQGHGECIVPIKIILHWVKKHQVISLSIIMTLSVFFLCFNYYNYCEWLKCLQYIIVGVFRLMECGT